jgi:alpha-galactosidase
MPIIHTTKSDTGRAFWIIHTHRTSYGFGLDRLGYLEHMYWGPRLHSVDDFESPEVIADNNYRELVTREEFPAWGDFKFNEPCLKVTFADGVRAALLHYADTQIEEGNGISTLTITLKDAHYPLEVQLIYRVYEDYDLIERSAKVTNTGSDVINIEQILSAAWDLPRRDSYQLNTLNGKWGGEFHFQTVDVPMGKQVVERRRGASGFDSSPWFSIGADHATTENHGEVWFGTLAFSGNFKLVVERTSYDQVTVSGGINNFDFLWALQPGETFETPVFVGGYTEDGYGEASRLLHAYQIAYVVPRESANTPRPVVYNSWYVTEFDVRIENQIRAAELAAQIGVELFVMDDGWFGKRNNDKAGLGDWYVNEEKFPEGLGPLIQRVKELGMDFGIWVEPEMVNPDSDLYRAHPEWVYHFPNRPISTGRNQYVLNVARQDVQDFIVGFLDDLLANNDVRFIKWDMNRHFSEPGWPDAPAGRDREIWVRHTLGLYDILRRVREKHPHVLWESCSGGGGRVDLGVMRYTEQFWMSDNTDPYDDLFIMEGFTQAQAPLTRMMWVTDTNWINGRPFNLDYRFHLAMMGVMGIGADLPTWSEDKLQTAANHIATYKEIRQTVQFGKLYRLRSPRKSALTAVQFVHKDAHESVVFAFLSASTFGEFRAALRLEGLEPDAQYHVEELDLTLSGQALMKRGLSLALKGAFVSQMLRIRRV